MNRVGGHLILASLVLAPLASSLPSDLDVRVTVDLRTTPPVLDATLLPRGAEWSADPAWPLPSGTLLRVVDGTGAVVPSEITDDGILRFAPGNASEVHVVLETDPPTAREGGLLDLSFRADAEGDFTVVAPDGFRVLDLIPLPDARVLLGAASFDVPSPPALPGLSLVRVLDVGKDSASISLWWQAPRAAPGPGDVGVPDGWREVGRADLWGALSPGAEPWTARSRPSLLRLDLEPDRALDMPLAGIGVEVRGTDRAFASIDGEMRPVPRASHATVETGAPGWSRAEGGGFIVFAKDAADAQFVAEAGARAAPVLARVLADAGLPARGSIPVVLSPIGTTGWQRWGFVQPEAFVRELRESGETRDEAAILVHEGFHGGQFDAAPWLNLAWWAEGTAGETDRYVPNFEPPVLAGADLARFQREPFPFDWRQPDPRLTQAETGYRYAASRHIAATFRDRVDGSAWREVWSRIGNDTTCCDHAELMAILVDVSGLPASSIERASDDAPASTSPRSPVPFPSLALALALALVIRASSGSAQRARCRSSGSRAGDRAS